MRARSASCPALICHAAPVNNPLSEAAGKSTFAKLNESQKPTLLCGAPPESCRTRLLSNLELEASEGTGHGSIGGSSTLVETTHRAFDFFAY